MTHSLAYGFGFVGGGVGRVPGWVVHVCWFGCRLALARGSSFDKSPNEPDIELIKEGFVVFE